MALKRHLQRNYNWNDVCERHVNTADFPSHVISAAGSIDSLSVLQASYDRWHSS